MPTTAGTHLLRNTAADAFIITQIKDKGAIILEKQTCEWANFLFLA
jgi:amidase